MSSAAELADHGSTRMPPTAQQWLAPVGVRPAEDAVEWLPGDSLARDGVVVPSDGLLEDFLALESADSAQVVDFAARHGVLGLSAGRWYRPGEYAREPLTAWRDAATRASALLTAAARLRAGQLLTDDQRVPVLRAAWPDVVPFYPLDTDPAAAEREALLMHSNRTLESDRTTLAWAVSTWMEEAGAHLVLTWPPGAGAPVLTIGGEKAHGCLPAITVQVALACSRAADTTRTCDGCGALHAPRRQPKPGQRSFCQKCRHAGVPVRLANRDRKARQRQEKAERA